MRVEVLHSTVPGAWAKFEDVIARVRKFSEDYDSSMDVNVLIEFMKGNFVVKQPSTLVLANVDDEGIVRGHLLAVAERWFGINVTTVVQVASDVPLSKDTWDVSERALRLFSKFHQCKFTQIAARSRAAARLFSRHGFKETHTLMRRSVEGEAGKLPAS